MLGRWLANRLADSPLPTVTTRPLTQPHRHALTGRAGLLPHAAAGGARRWARGLQRSLARWLVGGLVSGLLLAQMAVVSYACPAQLAALRAGGPPQAQAPQPAVLVMAAAMPDCSQMAGATDPGSANLCAEHCKNGQQSDQTPTLVLPFALLMVLYTTPPAPAAALPGATAAAQDARLAPPPGHAVLHCVYRL